MGNRCRETDQRAAPVTDSCHDREARYARQEADRGLRQSDPPMTDFDLDLRCVACGRRLDVLTDGELDADMDP